MSMKVIGASELMKQLREVLADWKDAEVRKIVAAGAAPIIEEAKRLAPVSRRQHFYTSAAGERVTFMPGNLRESIKVLPKFRGDPRGVFVGPKIVRRNASGTYGGGSRVNAYYAHFVEYGTRSHSIGYKGKYASGRGPVVRGITAQPYMRPAYDSRGSQSVELIKTALVDAIEKKRARADQKKRL